jgi:glycosyltransferase involved in cell wall biosynthesis
MTRIVHVINSLAQIGGAERLVLDLAKCSKERPVTVISWWGRDNSLMASDVDGAIDLIAVCPFNWKALTRALNAIKRAEVVHLHLFPTLYLGPFINKPTLYTEHNTWNRRRDRPALRPIERWCYSRINKVVAISKATANALTDWLGEPPPKLSVISNGVRLSRFDNVPRRHRGGPVVLGMAARFSFEKDHRTLIEAMAYLPNSYSLRLAGDGELFENIKMFARQQGVFDRVDFAGVIQDMPEFYRSLDLYVQSSKYDGFSLVAVEAMASGLPTLVSDIEGLRCTVGNVQLLFPAADAHALARLITRIAQDAELYESLAIYCVGQSQKFSITEVANHYEFAYAELAEVGRPPSNGG